ncbi:CAF1-domain-containing protein [Astrocystis sublimbata]|nr:CAF1-domain-containing protein [Astrocystis sublimbata]
MEVNATTFWAALPDIMGAMVDSRWVAIDVEMSGISTGGHLTPPGSTLQEAYQSVKEAAETYQILQIGFTFCKYNEITSKYETKTIECPITPLFPPGPGHKALTHMLDRKFTTSALSYTFLSEHKLSVGKMLDSGTPYLSREEEIDLKRQIILIAGDSPIGISRLSRESLKFYSFYKFFIQREVQVQQFRFRHVFDALAGGDFASKIKPNMTPRTLRSRPIDPHNSHKSPGFGSTLNLSQAEELMKARAPIVVGHNIFHDLAFIYCTFFGRLPEDLEEYLSTIHKLFPRIIDTKYMFLRCRERQGQVATDRSLSELHCMFADRQFPCIQPIDNSFEGRYLHHAGYDSALTMMVFLKQTVYIKSCCPRPHDAPEQLDGSQETISRGTVFRETILDKQREWEKASQRGLARYTPLQPGQDTFLSGHLFSRPIPSPQSPRQRLEHYSVKESAIIPAWDDSFWREFGNKTRIGNAGIVEFK